MFSIDKSITTTYPGTKMGILIMREVSYSGSYEEQELVQVVDRLRQKYSHLDRKELKEIHPVQAYVAYYKKFGYSYHLLAQLESVLKGKKDLHSESGLLQAMFISELDSMLLTAGYDLDQLQFPLLLKSATGMEAYRSISSKKLPQIREIWHYVTKRVQYPAFYEDQTMKVVLPNPLQRFFFRFMRRRVSIRVIWRRI